MLKSEVTRQGRGRRGWREIPENTAVATVAVGARLSRWRYKELKSSRNSMHYSRSFAPHAFGNLTR